MAGDIPLLLAALIPGLLICKLGYGLIYNLFFHPLSKFSGPPTSGWSKLHLMYTFSTGKHHDYEYAAHKKYGKCTTHPTPTSYPQF